MILTITSTHRPATDIGFLLHKNPGRIHSTILPFGQAHVFYPEATAERCTVALALDVDPVGLVRRPGQSGRDWALQQYVNDKPYAASSFMSVAISRVFGTAMKGKSKEREELARTPIPLTARIAALPCREGKELIHSLFEPLGYAVRAEEHLLDERFPQWGESPYYSVELSGTVRLSELLTHLYVLVPVLDDDKHYWVGDDEVDKLLRHGEGWLSAHPAREQITARYLRHLRSLTDDALARLADDDGSDAEQAEETRLAEEQSLERPLNLNQERIRTVATAVRESGAKRVLDLGCGEGVLLRELFKDTCIVEIVGLDVSMRALARARDGVKMGNLPEAIRNRLKLIQGSLTYRDKRLSGFDAAAVVEVIEHLDEARLSAFERVLFEFARPGTAVITTPNVEYNQKFEGLPEGHMRHKDHRFEWTRQQFREWSERVCSRFGYAACISGIGPEDAAVGTPTQMAVFTRE